MRIMDIVTQRINQSLLPEALERIKALKVNDGDRVRVVFEFEIVKKPTSNNRGMIKDAVEIRHRRPWE